ncbi:MAG TPA: PKD domain-containing protein [Solirubrobacterales bacterium]
MLAAAGPGVLVEVPGGGRTFIDAGELAPEAPGTVAPQGYTVRVRPGEAGEEVARGGLPVRTLIERAGVDPDSFGYLTVTRPDGTSAFLPASDFASAPPFEGGKPALVSVDVGSTRFFRPLTGSEDVNAEDNIATASGEALLLGLRDGNILQVRASATPRSAPAGTSVRFSAGAGGALPGERVSFHWSFGDGTTAEGAAVTHRFSGSGSYEVRATAVGSDESGGESGPIAVVVGKPPKAAQPGATLNAGKAKPPRKGGTGEGGREGRGGNGTEPSGAASPAEGTGVPSETGAGAPSEAGTGVPATPLPGLIPTAPPAEEPAPERSEAPTPPAAKAPQPAPSLPGGETVEGILVADALGPGVASAERGSAAAGGSESAAGASDDGGATVPAAALLVLALLTAGALLEWRGTRPRLR